MHTAIGVAMMLLFAGLHGAHGTCSMYCSMCNADIKDDLSVTGYTCLGCLDGYALNIFTNECQACANCLGPCAYVSYATRCSQCADGYMANSNGICEPCPDGCNSCSSVGDSIACDVGGCAVGYIDVTHDSNCTECLAGCSRKCDYILHNLKCHESPCDDGYAFAIGFNDNGPHLCIPCPANCVGCTHTYTNEMSKLLCTQSATGYVLEDNLAYACHPRCDSCLDNGKDLCDDTKCHTGTMFNTDTFECDACADNCEYCTEANTCSQCADGFFKTNNDICKSCGSNCKSCNADGCDICIEGYILNEEFECLECDINCEFCSVKDGIAICIWGQCKIGYTMSEDMICNACPMGCIACMWDGVTTMCIGTCMIGYGQAKDGSCTKCPDHCDFCKYDRDRMKCYDSGCDDGYYLSENEECTICGVPTTCKTCFEDGDCLTCLNQEVLVEGQCIECDSNCLPANGCTEAGKCNVIGSRCAAGFYMDNEGCAACIWGCSTCDNTASCLSCNDGHYLKDAACTDCQDVAPFCVTTTCLSCATCTESVCLTCPEGSVLNEDGACIACDTDDCATCPQDVCSSCKMYNRLIIDHDVICTGCRDTTCERCDVSIENCTKCGTNKLPQPGSECTSICSDDAATIAKIEADAVVCISKVDAGCLVAFHEAANGDATDKCMEGLCREGFYFDPNDGKCSSCPSNCGICRLDLKTQETTCRLDGCQKGYGLVSSGECQRCPLFCDRCIWDSEASAFNCRKHLTPSNSWCSHGYVELPKNECIKCPAGCDECFIDSSNALQCVEGKCSEGHVYLELKDRTICFPCPMNCLECSYRTYDFNDMGMPRTSMALCNICMRGYYKEPNPERTCYACPAFCDECRYNVFLNDVMCDECNVGYLEKDSDMITCDECTISNCVECSMDDDGVHVCSACITGYGVHAGSTCVKCGDQCLECNDTDQMECTSCKLGYTLSDEDNPTTCIVETCIEIDPDTSSCSQCVDGYYGDECEPCTSASCLSCASDRCMSCEEGWGIAVTDCQECSIHICSVCVFFPGEATAEKCTKCNVGFAIYDSNDEQSPIIGTACIQCPFGCLNCTYNYFDEKTECTEDGCLEGFSFETENGECKECSTGCDICEYDTTTETTVCTEYGCSFRYTFNSESIGCDECPYGCNNCTYILTSATPQCVSEDCFDGYVLNKDSSVCERCPDNCYACSYFDHTVECDTGGCHQHYTLNEDSRNCNACPENCAECTWSAAANEVTCTICKRGYGHKYGECRECPHDCHECSVLGSNRLFTCDSCEPGYAANHMTCAECPRFCVECSHNVLKEVVCDECQTGYGTKDIKSITCDLCTISNCAECIMNSVGVHSCRTCITGYGLNDQSKCIECGAACTACEYQTDQMKCITCEDGFTNPPSSTSNCTACNEDDEHCTTCHSDPLVCTGCEDNWINDAAGLCIAFSTIENCALYDDGGECEICTVGYINSGSCSSCMVNCETCDDENTCRSCMEGYMLDSSMCTACDINKCAACVNLESITSIQCTKCEARFAIYDSSADQSTTTGSACLQCPIVCDECTYDYILETTVCNFYGCFDGHAFNTDTKTCQECTDNCDACTYASQIMKCDTGHCDNLYALNEQSGQCVSCPDGCLDCSWSAANGVMCNTCIDTNGVTGGQCSACPGHCHLCSVKEGDNVSLLTCDTCQSGYAENDMVCGACSTHCLTCSDEQGTMECDICEEGYAIHTITKQCVECPAFCEECSYNEDIGQLMCVECQIRYVIKDGDVTCNKCTISNCADCNMDVSGVHLCITCITGYGLGENSECVECPIGCAGCMYCTDRDVMDCTVCEYGYTDLPGAEDVDSALNCTACNGVVEHCTTCTYSTAAEALCTGCEDGWYNDDTDVCVENNCHWRGNDGTCLTCNYGHGGDNCDVCTATDCLSCDNGGTCTKCREGFAIGTTSTCEDCGINKCSECSIESDINLCNICNVGYGIYDSRDEPSIIIGTACLECPTACNSCEFNYTIETTICKSDSCFQGYVFINENSDCEECPAACNDCMLNVISGNTECNINGCYDGYSFNTDNIECEKCPDNCDVCSYSAPNMQCNAKNCHELYIFNEDSRQCDPCPDRCRDCSWSIADGVTCNTCNEGYGVTGGMCRECRENCLECSVKGLDQSLLNCDICDSGYAENNLACAECPSFCDKCWYDYSFKEVVCEQCQSGYTTKNSLAVMCDACSIAYCAKCSMDSDGNVLCSRCITGYGFDEQSNCISCVEGCTTCNSMTEMVCTACEDGYMQDGQGCKACGDDFDFCTKCVCTECLACTDGYSLGDGACVDEIVDNCYIYSDDGQCEQCLDGFFGPTCEPCMDNCINCTNANDCMSCEKGHGLLEDTSVMTCEVCLINKCDNCELTLGVAPPVYDSGCIICEVGHAIYDSSSQQSNIKGSACIKCPDNCNVCTYDYEDEKTVCELGGCFSRYALNTDNIECEECSFQCINCRYDNIHKQFMCDHDGCFDRYALNTDSDECNECPQNCNTCSYSGSIKCNVDSCDNFYARDEYSGKCYACPVNCLNCNWSATDGVMCNTCEDSYGVTRGQCSECPWNCQQCSVAGADESLLTCDTCEFGYVENYMACTVCPPFCEACHYDKRHNDLVCDECESGYVTKDVNSFTCDMCTISNCAECIMNSFGVQSCRACIAGYGLESDSNCIPCTESFCTRCDDDPQTCSSCENDYYYKDTESSCLDITLVDNCIAYVNGTCFLCDDGHRFDGESCVVCSAVDCKDCSETLGECISCLVGWVVTDANSDLTNEKCQDCEITNCVGCTVGWDDPSEPDITCTECAVGYALHNSGCTECPENCGECNNSTTGLRCNVGQCNNDYVLNEDTGECNACPYNCADCSWNVRTGRMCNTCDDGYGVIDGQCRECPGRCRECSLKGGDSLLTCDSCQLGYVENHMTCAVCPPFCDECSYDSVVGDVVCNQCLSGYGIKNSESVICDGCTISNCAECTMDLAGVHLCSACIVGYQLIANNCHACSALSIHCTECGGDQCNACEDGWLYFSSGSTCTELNIENCSSYNQAGECIQCDDGYKIDSGINFCELCMVTNCKGCTNDPAICTMCEEGWQLFSSGTDGNGDTCVDCETNGCVACTVSINLVVESCTDCIGGYAINTADAQNPCRKCPTGCTLCTFDIAEERSLCNSDGCFDGFTFNGDTYECEECSNNCEMCTSDGTRTHCNSDGCSDRYAYNSVTNECKECTFGCNQCTMDGNSENTICISDSCIDRFVFNVVDYGCVACPDHCDDCGWSVDHVVTCVNCNDGYEVSNGQCIACPGNCQDCAVKGDGVKLLTCVTCLSGFVENNFYMSCAACPSNCLNCTDEQGMMLCNTCTDGYALHHRTMECLRLVYTVVYIPLDEKFIKAYTYMENNHAARMILAVTNELFSSLQNESDIFESAEVILLREKDGLTYVDAEIISMSAVDSFNANSVQGTVQTALDRAANDGLLGGYGVGQDPHAVNTPQLGVPAERQGYVFTRVGILLDVEFMTPFTNLLSAEVKALKTVVENEINAYLTDDVEDFQFAHVVLFRKKGSKTIADLDIASLSVIDTFNANAVHATWYTALNKSVSGGALEGYVVLPFEEDAVQVNMPQLGFAEPIKVYVFTRASFQLHQHFDEAYVNITNEPAQELIDAVERELDVYLNIKVIDYSFENIVLLRLFQGLTVLDLDVVSLSLGSTIDVQIVQQSVRAAILETVKDGYVMRMPSVRDYVVTQQSRIGSADEIPEYKYSQISFKLNSVFVEDYSDLNSESSQKLLQFMKAKMMHYFYQYIPGFQFVKVQSIGSESGSVLLEVDIATLQYASRFDESVLTEVIKMGVSKVKANIDGLESFLMDGADNAVEEPEDKIIEAPTPALISLTSTIRLMMDFDDEYANIFSDKAYNLIAAILPELRNNLREYIQMFETAYVVGLSEGSVLVDVVILYRSDSASYRLTRDNVTRAMTKTLQDGLIGNLPADPEPVVIGLPIKDPDITLCGSNPCGNRGTCIAEDWSFSCTCQKGQEGLLCQTSISTSERPDSGNIPGPDNGNDGNIPAIPGSPGFIDDQGSNAIDDTNPDPAPTKETAKQGSADAQGDDEAGADADDGLSSGSKAGVVIGCLLAVCGLIGAAAVGHKIKKKRNEDAKASPPHA